MAVKVFARFFRGFSKIEVRLEGMNFVLGDNSSGKSSLLHLIDVVLRDDLESVPTLNEELGVSAYDYFSPLFSNKDVVVGFTKDNQNGPYTKIITVTKVKGTPPTVIRCSYFTNDLYISLLRREGKVLKRIGSAFSGSTEEYLEKHNSDEDFEVCELNLPENASLASLATLVVFLMPDQVGNKETDSKVKINSILLRTSLPSCSFVGPIRSLPEKYYDQTRRFSPVGLHFASMWANIPKRYAATYFRQITNFGKESGLFDRVWVEPISVTVEDSPLLVHVSRNGHDFLMNQVGVGVSQIAPVLAEAIYSASNKRKRVALFQQPELHLHPVAQAALGSFFAKLSKDGLTAFLETHSNYLIDRFRSDFRKMRKHSRPARVLFCETREDGNVVIECDLGSDGNITGAPDSYYDFFLQESLRTML